MTMLTLAFTACVKRDVESPAIIVKLIQPLVVQSSTDNPNNSFKTYYLKQHNNRTSKGLQDSISVVDTVRVPSIKINDTIQYIKFKSFWTGDNGQANVYEIEAYSGGKNVALNKPDSASSISPDAYINSINDGDYTTRWSSDRNIDSHNDAEFQVTDTSNVDWANITINLQQIYLIDSIRLHLFSTDSTWTAWKQTFGLYTSKDIIKWDSIGGGINVNQLTW